MQSNQKSPAAKDDGDSDNLPPAPGGPSNSVDQHALTPSNELKAVVEHSNGFALGIGASAPIQDFLNLSEWQRFSRNDNSPGDSILNIQCSQTINLPLSEMKQLTAGIKSSLLEETNNTEQFVLILAKSNGLWQQYTDQTIEANLSDIVVISGLLTKTEKIVPTPNLDPDPNGDSIMIIGTVTPDKSNPSISICKNASVLDLMEKIYKEQADKKMRIAISFDKNPLDFSKKLSDYQITTGSTLDVILAKADSKETYFKFEKKDDTVSSLTFASLTEVKAIHLHLVHDLKSAQLSEHYLTASNALLYFRKNTSLDQLLDINTDATIDLVIQRTIATGDWNTTISLCKQRKNPRLSKKIIEALGKAFAFPQPELYHAANAAELKDVKQQKETPAAFFQPPSAAVANPKNLSKEKPKPHKQPNPNKASSNNSKSSS